MINDSQFLSKVRILPVRLSNHDITEIILLNELCEE